jgi:hypothetical protein
MTTQEMIEVMQAYERGEEIEMRLANCEEYEWAFAGLPVWNWEKFEYRIKPKEPKFKVGDEIVCKSSRGIANPEVWCVGSPVIEGIDLDDFVKADDVLWYWEYQDVSGEWKITNARYTKSDLNKEVLGPNERETAIPLYALGFRLPREKDKE